jgi:hypothetical protein
VHLAVTLLEYIATDNLFEAVINDDSEQPSFKLAQCGGAGK